MKQTLLTLSWLFILFLFALMVYGLWPRTARADAVPAYILIVATYASDEGHTMMLRSYLDVIQAPYPDKDSCEAARGYTYAHYHPHRDPKTLAVHLAEIWCMKNPGKGVMP